MIANKEEIRVGQVIVHILDSTVGMPVLSDTVLDYGSDFADFIKAHIFKTDNSDDIRRCVFEEESAIYSYLQEWNSENFVDFSKKIRIRGEIIMRLSDKKRFCQGKTRNFQRRLSSILKLLNMCV